MGVLLFPMHIHTTLPAELLRTIFALYGRICGAMPRSHVTLKVLQSLKRLAALQARILLRRRRLRVGPITVCVQRKQVHGRVAALRALHRRHPVPAHVHFQYHVVLQPHAALGALTLQRQCTVHVVLQLAMAEVLVLAAKRLAANVAINRRQSMLQVSVRAQCFAVRRHVAAFVAHLGRGIVATHMRPQPRDAGQPDAALGLRALALQRLACHVVVLPLAMLLVHGDAEERLVAKCAGNLCRLLEEWSRLRVRPTLVTAQCRTIFEVSSAIKALPLAQTFGIYSMILRHVIFHALRRRIGDVPAADVAAAYRIENVHNYGSIQKKMNTLYKYSLKLLRVLVPFAMPDRRSPSVELLIATHRIAGFAAVGDHLVAQQLIERVKSHFAHGAHHRYVSTQQFVFAAAPLYSPIPNRFGRHICD